MSPQSTQRPQRLNRLLPKVLVCLLLGLALNFGVAYACAKWSPITTLVPKFSMSDIENGTPPILPSGRGLGVVEYRESKRDGDEWTARIGLPLPTATLNHKEGPGKIFDFSLDLPWDRPDTSPALQHFFDLTGRRTSSILPLGTTINTLFYAAIVFVLWIAPGALIRRNRARRGLCRRCAYDITGVAVCPECGTPSSPPVA